MENISVEGIVSARDKKPYVCLFKQKEGKPAEQFAQLSIAEARNIAMDILIMCSRTEADAMIYEFFSKNKFPMEAAAALMYEFRQFRQNLDEEKITTTVSEPIMSHEVDPKKPKN